MAKPYMYVPVLRALYEIGDIDAAAGYFSSWVGNKPVQEPLSEITLDILLALEEKGTSSKQDEICGQIKDENLQEKVVVFFLEKGLIEKASRFLQIFLNTDRRYQAAYGRASKKGKIRRGA